MTKILKLRVINILSDELFCIAGLEHDFNCLIVKRIFDKEGGRCLTRLVEDAVFFGSDDFSYFKWQKSLCVVCASCVLLYRHDR